MSKAVRGYVLECFWPGATERALLEATERVEDAAAELRRQGSRAALRSAVLVRPDETVFCLFDGDEDDVREIGRRAGLPFERVLATTSVLHERGSA